jgi:hypothetical protein
MIYNYHDFLEKSTIKMKFDESTTSGSTKQKIRLPIFQDRPISKGSFQP